MTLTKLREKWDSFDVVKALLANKPEDKDIISCSIPVLHSALFKLKKSKKYRQFFDSYLFEDRIDYQYSRAFQTDLSNLELSGHLSTINPDFVNYTIQPKLKRTYELYTKDKFSLSERDLIREMGKKFFNEIGKSEQRA